MSELSKLMGKGKVIKLGELELEIKPLTVSAMPLLMQLGEEDKTKQAEAMKELITITLKEAIPNATEEEIDNIPLEHMTKLMESVMEVNKLEDMNPDKKALLEKIKG